MSVDCTMCHLDTVCSYDPDDLLDEGVVDCGYPAVRQVEVHSHAHTLTPMEGETTLLQGNDSGLGDTTQLKCFDCPDCLIERKFKKLPLSSPMTHGPLWPLGDVNHAGFEPYKDEIYLHRLALEKRVHPLKSLGRQKEITPGMRAVMVSWVTKVHREHCLNPDSLFVTVNIIDRTMAAMYVDIPCLPLLGITALLIAAKIEEVIPPEINDLLDCCNSKYNREQVKKLETLVLLALRFDLLVPTSRFFLEYFSACCLSGCVDLQHGESLRQCRAMSRCILEMSLQDYQLCQYSPSLLALCAWKTAVGVLGVCDDNYYPPGIYCTRGRFDRCLQEVRAFTETFQYSFPDIASISENFRNLNGLD
ncbi:cyclin-O-like [Haliotis asinina]|uniref:cyclin-O-like n=1 Tax=Haliotis asinina TaxID=109174 RepID=UPI0035326FC2